jgi:hypothetical protein
LYISPITPLLNNSSSNAGTTLPAQFDAFAQRFCPVIQTLTLSYAWSIHQAESATDLVFKRQSDVQAFYPLLVEALIHAVKPTDIATFLGQKLYGTYRGEMGNRFNVRWLGSRLKHVMGPVSLKVYDKFGLRLRIETTVNDVTFFKEHRQVHHRNGELKTQWAPMKKTLYSLAPLAEQLQAANPALPGIPFRGRDAGSWRTAIESPDGKSH